MATIKVSFSVDKLSNVMSIFDVVKVYRSTTGELGVYSEITGAGTRVTLAAGQTVYVYDDVAGDPDYYYKTSYFNETTLVESSLSAAIKGDVEALYISVDDVRAEGVTAAVAGDDLVLKRIRMWQAFIERVTRLWFAPREVTWDFDGNGTTLAPFPVPIISVSALYLNEDFTTALAADEYKVYSGRQDNGRDDRRNPRIKLVTSEESIFAGTGSVRSRATVFTVGEKNQRVVGTFGYVETDGTTPEPIKYALTKLVVRSVRPMASSGGGSTPAGPMIEEETDRHRRRWADPFIGSKVFSVTGDPEIDQILASFRAPIKVGAPRTMWRRTGTGASP